MLRNYFLVAVRNMRRDKVFSLINIIGLAVGITCFLMLFLFIQDELTFDQYPSRTGSGDVYRLFVKSSINGTSDTNSKTSGSLGPLLQQEFPEVETYTRIGYFGPRAFLYKDKVFRDGSIYAVDSTFFRIFPLTFIEGDPNTALTQPNSIVLTETASRRIFGEENPVGKMLPTETGSNFMVTALIKDFPRKSHFRCEYLESLETYKVNASWLDLWYTTYVVLKPGSDPQAMEDKLKSVVIEHVGPEAESLLGVPIQQFLADGNSYGFFLQPFASIYLHSRRDFNIDQNTEWGNVTTSDIAYTRMFSAVAAFILLLAVINFMNLATAKSERRGKEVGIRKTFGSSRIRLMAQFIGEAVVMSLISMVLALLLLALLLPLFNSLIERDLRLVIVNDYLMAPLLLSFVLFVGILAGSYPAFYLSASKASVVLKGGVGGEGRKSSLRSALVTVQFGISIALLIGTLVIKRQVQFMQNKNLGFNKEHLLSISNANFLGTHVEAFKTELVKNPKIISLTNASRMFSTGVPGSGYLFNKKSGTDPALVQIVDVDHDFLRTFQIDLREGRFFSSDYPADSDACVVNEAAVKAFQTDQPLDKYLVSLDVREKGHAYKIIGVIRDFNYESLHTLVRPLVLHLRAPRQASTLTIRIASDDMRNTVAFMEEKWKEFAAGDPISYRFVDASLARLYAAEEKTNLVSIIFSMLAIFIACIGLFGLAAFVTERRTKEIGVRKVLGASSAQIVVLLSREFARWVVYSNLIAWPVAYIVMTDWLKNFAFKIDLSLGVFVLAGGLTFLIAFLTVAFHALKAAEADPARSLKYE